MCHYEGSNIRPLICKLKIFFIELNSVKEKIISPLNIIIFYIKGKKNATNILVSRIWTCLFRPFRFQFITRRRPKRPTKAKWTLVVVNGTSKPELIYSRPIRSSQIQRCSYSSSTASRPFAPTIRHQALLGRPHRGKLSSSTL